MSAVQSSSLSRNVESLYLKYFLRSAKCSTTLNIVEVWAGNQWDMVLESQFDWDVCGGNRLCWISWG